MKPDYFEQYAKRYDGLLTDLASLPLEAVRFLTACQHAIKEGIGFLSNYQEIYDFRPEFDTGFLNTIQKTAFTCTDETYQKCFIGISAGLVLSVYNIVYEALTPGTGFLDSYFGTDTTSDNKADLRKIKRSTIDPIDMRFLMDRFCSYRRSPLPEERQIVLDGIVFTALDFICKHEAAHFFRSHATFSHDGFHVGYFGEESATPLFACDSRQSPEKLFMRALESDADTQAVIMALRELEFEFTHDYTTDSVNQESVLDTLFEFGLAVGVLFLCLDNRVSFEIQRAGSHPPSIIRFQNAVYIMRKYFETIYDSDPEALLEEHVRILFEIENLAISMGYSEGLWVRFDAPKDALYLDLHEMMEFWEAENPYAMELLERIDRHATYDFIGLDLN